VSPTCSSGEPVSPDGEPTHGLYTWVTGVAGMVTWQRRRLAREAGLHRSQVAFMGDCRQGVAMRS
jgi:NADPH-dependent ferric siderophore reductase